MRNKIQKYLSGDHEGFSLVELIIVIAIMAILIGVVALAVLPYLEKSRESKDMSTMDTVCSALVTAVADTQVSDSGKWAFGNASAGTGSNCSTVETSMKETMGSASTALKSSKLNGCSIWCYYNAPSNIAYVYASNGGTTIAELNRTVTGYSATLGSDNKPQSNASGKAAIVSN